MRWLRAGIQSTLEYVVGQLFVYMPPGAILILLPQTAFQALRLFSHGARLGG